MLQNILDIFSLNTATKTATTTTTAPTTTVTVTESTTTESPLTSTILSTNTEEPMDMVDNTTLENPESTESQTETETV